MANKDVVVIGASAGGVEALKLLCRALPVDFPATVLIVQHMSPESQSVLSRVLARDCRLPVSDARDGAAPERGHVYVCVPDRHLLLRPSRMLLRRGPYENRTRPAVNALFRSAAAAYGPRVIGVVLTGALDDGTDGLIAIKQAGGTSVIQDPADAAWPSMPRQAQLRDHVDRSVPLADMAVLLSQLVRESAGPAGSLPAYALAEDRIAAQEHAVSQPEKPPGQPSPLSCPSCGGVLNEIDEDSTLRFRCQIGHAFTSLGLDAAQSEELEHALSVALRTHRERLVLFRRMEQAAVDRGFSHAAGRWRTASAEADHMADVIEQLLLSLSKQETEDAAVDSN